MGAVRFPEISSVQCASGSAGVEGPLSIASHLEFARFDSAKSTTWLNIEGVQVRTGARNKRLNAAELHAYADMVRGCAGSKGLKAPQTTALRQLGDKIDEIAHRRPVHAPRT